VAQAVADLGYETPTAIQRLCIPHLLAGRDLLGQAQTGTGKTAAFALPLLSRIDSSSKLPQVLVLTPTRELALQVAEAFQRYAQHLKGFHVLPIYGGQSYGLQVRQLERIPQVVVGTPGRIMDHIRRDTLSLRALKALVLDEADEMLDMGFAEDIDWIFEHTPPERQVALFSATMPHAILRVARDRLDDPVEVRAESATVTVATVEQRHCTVTRFHKADLLTRILELTPFDGMLIFVRTKGGTTELADKLRAQGFEAEPLNGDMNQEMRTRAVERLKGGQLDILVATDVAARGLDVERVSHVVNYDIPTDPSAYVHRIGRTGRAGRAGHAILLVEPRERGLLKAIERAIRQSIPEMDPPSAAQLSASRIDRFTEELRGTIAEQDLDFFYRLVTRIAKEQELEPLAIAAALSFQLQRERPLEVREPAREPRGERRPRDDRREERPRPQTRDREGFGGRRDEGRPYGARERGGPPGRFEPRGERPFNRDSGERPFNRDSGERPFNRGSGERPFNRDSGERPFNRDSGERPVSRDSGERRPYGGERQGGGDAQRRERPVDDRGPRPFREERGGFRQERQGYPQDRERGREAERPAGGFERGPRDERSHQGQGLDRGPGHEPGPGREPRPFREGGGDRPESRPPRFRDEPRQAPREGYQGRQEERREDGNREHREERRPFPRDERPPRPPRSDRPGQDLVRHRIEVGQRDGVTPREIVGAIANESGLEGRFIGAIDIRDDHSTVDLPPGMPRELFAHLKRVVVRGRPLRISLLDGPPRDTREPGRSFDDRGPRGPRRFGPDDRGNRTEGPPPHRRKPHDR
jgi:ATP-dependent RNA helicase DeaD